MANTEVDELFDIKNSLYIGNFQHCINEAQKIQPREESVRVERDVCLYRAFLGQRKYGVIQSQIKPNAAPQLQAIKLVAKFLQNPKMQDAILPEVESLLTSSSLDPGSSMVALSAAIIYCHLDNYEEALRVLNQHDTLECRTYMIHCYLAMNRLENARKELKGVLEKDDDATLAQLAQAWVHISSGGDKLQDAYYIYQELIDKNTSTPLLLAGQAACFIGQNKTEEAESALQEALDKDSDYAETLVNLMVLSHHTAKPQEVSGRYLAQLKDSHSSHPVVTELNSRESDFERIVRQYAPTQA